jgi:hypothetical protein
MLNTVNLNGPILDALFRWLRFDRESMLRYPPGDCDRVLVMWALLLLEVYALIGLVFWALRARRKASTPAGADEPTDKRATARRILGSMALAIAAVAFYFGALEFAVRSYVASQPPTNFIPHPLYMWRFGPHLKNFEMQTPVGPMVFDTNTEGLRAEDVPAAKEPNEFRILTLGDSATFGQSVGFQQTWSQQLERLLAAKYPDRKIRVINGGVPGYSVLQGYYLMREIGLAYHPDLVIVNEFNEYTNRQVGELDTVVPRSELAATVKEWLWSSMVYMTLRKMVARFTHPEGPVPPPPMAGPLRDIQPDTENIDYMSRFVELFKSHHIKAAFVLWRRHLFWQPTLDKLLEGEPSSRYLTIDLHDILVNRHSDVFWLKGDPSQHPSVMGHLLMAQDICDALVANHVIAP